MVAEGLVADGHDVLCVFTSMRGAADRQIIGTAVAEDRVLITNDRDFGDAVFRDGLSHRGVIFLRLQDERPSAKLEIVRRVIREFGDVSPRQFITANEIGHRIAEP